MIALIVSNVSVTFSLNFYYAVSCKILTPKQQLLEYSLVPSCRKGWSIIPIAIMTTYSPCSDLSTMELPEEVTCKPRLLTFKVQLHHTCQTAFVRVLAMSRVGMRCAEENARDWCEHNPTFKVLAVMKANIVSRICENIFFMKFFHSPNMIFITLSSYVSGLLDSLYLVV